MSKLKKNNLFIEIKNDRLVKVETTESLCRIASGELDWTYPN